MFSIEKKLSTFATCNKSTHLQMKIRILPFLAASILAASSFLSSCLDSEYTEVTYSSESSITSFSIGTLHQEFIGLDSLGKDSVYTDTISYANYPFTIDQIKRTIENKDSLPKGVDITRVLASVKGDTDYIMYNKNGKDTLWTSTDSIDFSKPVEFKVMAYSGAIGKPYIVKINVHKQIPDTLEWAHFPNKVFNTNALTHQKAVVKENEMYVFGKNGSKVFVEHINIEQGRAASWKTLGELPAGTNTYSALNWNGTIYFAADGGIYKINENADPIYTRVGELNNIKNLIAVGKTTISEEVIFAYNDNKKVISVDANGNIKGDAEGLGFINDYTIESDRLSSISYQANHNSSLYRTIVMSNNIGKNSTDTTAYIYNYITNDTKWNRYSQNNPATCPNLENVSMISYDGKLYAFGGGMESAKIEPFESFYESLDNGLTWREVTSCMIFPKYDPDRHPDILPFKSYYTKGEEGSYSTVVDSNNFIWIIWKNGNITRGRINRLGFAQKW